jgi:ribosomal protein S18 acetylase RimI-like enzyme
MSSHNNGTNRVGHSASLNIPGLPGSFSLIAFFPKEASPRLWEAYFALSERIYRELNPKGRLPNRDTVKLLLSVPNPLYDVRRWLLLDERDTPAALISFSYDTEISPDYESSSHMCQYHIAVDPDHRRKKVATHLLRHMIHMASDWGKDTIRADADNVAGLEFCRYLHGHLVHRVNQYRLYLEDVDWNMVDEWCAKGRSRFPDTTIQSFQECPEEDINEFCRIYTEIINQRPVGDIQEDLITTAKSRRIEELSFKKKQIEWHTMISREGDGHISALTDIMYNPQEPHRVHQYFTGVLSKYRRRGLAKRLKAEMLLYIRERFPEAEYVTTTTAKENDAMRAINKQLGFESRNALYMFQWSQQDLERRTTRILTAIKPANSLMKKQ